MSGSKEIPEILYFAPRDRLRTPIADYASSYAMAMDESKLVLLRRAFMDYPSENLNAREDGLGLVRRRVRDVIRSNAINSERVIHAEIGHNTLREFWGAVYASKMLRHAPVCLTVHEPPHLTGLVPPGEANPRVNYLERLLTSITSGMAIRAQRSMRNGFLSNITAIFALSERAAIEMASQYPEYYDRIAVLPPMIIGPVPAAGDLDRKKPTDPVQVTVFGALDGDLRIEQLVNALIGMQKEKAVLGKMRVAIRCWGDDRAAQGALERKMLAQIDEASLRWLFNIRMGLPSSMQLNELMALTDILVLPCRDGIRSSGLYSLFRAQAWKTAILASSGPPFSDLFQEPVEGFTYPTGNIKALADQLRVLVQNDDLRKSLGEALRNRALKFNNSENIAARMTGIYRELLVAQSENRPPLLAPAAAYTGAAAS